MLFIANPEAGGGRARKLWTRHEAALRAQGLTPQVHWTQAAGEASAVVAAAFAGGTRRFVAVGGDGTVNEVLNGLASAFAAPDTPRPWMAVLPAGTGNDWAHQLGLPRHPADWAAAITSPVERRHDVGRLRFEDGRTHYFAVECGAGFDTHVLGLLSRRGPRQLAYIRALVRGLFTFKGPALDLLVHGDEGHSTRLGSPRSMVAFGANGPWTGGGMHIAPDAKFDDGWLDFVTVRDAGPWYNLFRLPKLFNGRLHADPQVQTARARSGVLSLTPPMAVQCDGQVVGRTPVTIDLLPGALLVPGMA